MTSGRLVTRIEAATAGLLATAILVACLLPRRASVASSGPVVRLPAVPALPRTDVVAAAEEARRLLDEGRPWAAWLTVRPYVRQSDPDDLDPYVVLTAARAAAGWGGWSHVVRLLEDRPWLDREEGGIGWSWLARAYEARGSWAAAAQALRQYLALAPTSERSWAVARYAWALARAGHARGAAEAFARARAHLPTLADWFQVWEAEAWLAAGEPSAAARQTDVPTGSAPVRARRAVVRAQAWAALGRPDLALARLRSEAERLAADGDGPEWALVMSMQAQLLHAFGREREARDVWRTLANDPRAPAAARATAADSLARWPDRTAIEEAARSVAYEAAGQPDKALAAWRAALRSGLPMDGSALLRLGRLAFAARDWNEAREAFRQAEARLADPEAQAEAALGAARARARSGDREGATEELQAILARWPTTAAAGTAAFLLGDLARTRVAAIAYYARAARYPASPYAADALVRLGDRRLRAGDLDGALAAWQEYLRRYPRGDEAARLAYRGGRALSRAGRAGEARRWYETAIAVDPLSYYAMRAGDRLGVDHLADALLPRPTIGLAEEANLAREVLDRLALLDSLGAEEAWRAEFEAVARRLRTQPLATVVLAEGLRARHPVEAIRLVRTLVEVRAQPWDRRLLLVLFPFLYRDLIEEEARRAGVDPFLLAGLIRQESSFRADARSWAGARGLAQIMPATGAWLARATLPVPFDPDLLDVPEVNVRMGATYLADMLRRYNGRVDYALAAYNAGPGRVDRWRRGLPTETDEFREAIPIAETRSYVQLVLRNQEVYRRLYGE